MDATALTTVEEIFEAFGGTGAFARALNLKLSTASEMRRRSSIPLKHWEALLDAARQSNIALTQDMVVKANLQKEVSRTAEADAISRSPFQQPREVDA